MKPIIFIFIPYFWPSYICDKRAKVSENDKRDKRQMYIRFFNFSIFCKVPLVNLFFFHQRWVQLKRDELQSKNSSLEFKLHRLKFIDLVKEGQWREALEYSKNFSRFTTQMKGICV